MKLAIASDHGGFRLKGELLPLLSEAGHAVTDLGTNAATSCDYPDFAHRMAKGILAGEIELGILLCGTGVGMSIAANRHAGIRAVVCSDVYSARLSRNHNASNVLCMGERVVGPGLAWEIAAAWLNEPPSTDERHARRRRMIEI